jgi:hypothetical protein
MPPSSATSGPSSRWVRQTLTHDLSSLREYIALDNQLETRDQQVEIQGLIEPESNAKFLGQLYLALYVIGSVVALGGQALD